MKCIIPGVNIKVFGRAIHSLAKIGDELYFEPLEQGLSLRTVNSSRSAYACFLFFPSYFQHYDDGTPHDEMEQAEDEEEGLRCKITIKSIMAVFRSLSTIEKTVEKCKITHNMKEARIVFELHCRHGIVKTHNLAYIECETLQAIFSKDLCPNKLTAPSKLLCEVVVNFQTTQEEVTLTLRPDTLSLKNYVEDEPDPSKVVHTELSLAPEEFDQYQVGVDAEITFCLKELRAILAFGETTSLPVNINFESAGRPVTFCIDSDQTFEANFVLATLADADPTSSQQPASLSQRPQPASSQRPQAKLSSASGKARRGKEPPEKVKQSRHAELSRPSLAEDNMADISAEELAAAMEAEEGWEEERGPGDKDAQHENAEGRRENNSSSETERRREKDSGREKEKRGGGEDQTQERTEMERRREKDRGREKGGGGGKREERTEGQRDRGVDKRREREKDGRELGKEKGSHSALQGGRENEGWLRVGRGEREDEQGGRREEGRRERTEEEGGGRQREGRRERTEEGGKHSKGRGESEEEERGGSGRGRGERETEGSGEVGSSSPVIPVQCPEVERARERPCLQPLDHQEEDDDDLDDTIPGTPPAKKFRSLFFGSSQKGSLTSQRPKPAVVLAADTDDED